jgi:hypothetical protein
MSGVWVPYDYNYSFHFQIKNLKYALQLSNANQSKLPVSTSWILTFSFVYRISACKRGAPHLKDKLSCSLRVSQAQKGSAHNNNLTPLRLGARSFFAI